MPVQELRGLSGSPRGSERGLTGSGLGDSGCRRDGAGMRWWHGHSTSGRSSAVTAGGRRRLGLREGRAHAYLKGGN